jgi:dienelactone hydrolase
VYPCCSVYGGRDMRVPAVESAARISGEVLRHAPNADVAVRIFPGADHSFGWHPVPVAGQ